jgi:hypothetical protein
MLLSDLQGWGQKTLYCILQANRMALMRPLDVRRQIPAAHQAFGLALRDTWYVDIA